jgi:SAM-dependent methyltransferase
MAGKEDQKDDIPAAERGVTEAQRARLLASMDVTMRQKLAFVSAHFQLHDGARILDIGCGSGKSSFELALLNPHLHVVALDYDAGYIEKAKELYKLPNLTFVQGDARTLDVGDEKFDAILNSGLMHEIYSFNGYSDKAVDESLDAQLRCLKDGGVILLRDFMRPPQPDAMVYLDLPPKDHARVNELSYPDRLRAYSAIANAEKPEGARGFFCEHVETLPDGWERFYLSHDWAYEFIWRKEYTARFEREAHEKYGVWRTEQYREIPESKGARVVYQAPYYNPWIAHNWHEGKFRLWDAQMKPLPAPSSNYVALIQKLAPGQAQSLREHKPAVDAPRYLKLEHFLNTRTGGAYDLVSRPGEVIDVLPYAVAGDGRVTVYAKSGYPRPLVNSQPRQMSPNIDGKVWSGHMVEPLAAANVTGTLSEEVRRLLSGRTPFTPESVREIEPGLTYYTAPSDVNERVSSAFVRVDGAPYEGDLRGQFSHFSSDGSVRAFDLQDLLRSVQVGMLPEARLEMNAYALLRRLRVAPEEWIGDTYKIAAARVTAGNTKAGPRQAFVPSSQPAHYLRTLRSVFVEEGCDDGARKVMTTQEFEFAVPDRRTGGDISTNSAMIVPLLRDERTGEIMIGLEDRDFPAVQAQEGRSDMTAIPGLRLPSAVQNLPDVRDYVAQKMGVGAADVQRLGESYFPSMGIMPNRVFPYVVTGADLLKNDKLVFRPLRAVFADIESCRNAHMVVAVMRTVHALGLWREYAPQATPVPGAPAAGV